MSNINISKVEHRIYKFTNNKKNIMPMYVMYTEDKISDGYIESINGSDSYSIPSLNDLWKSIYGDSLSCPLIYLSYGGRAFTLDTFHDDFFTFDRSISRFYLTKSGPNGQSFAVIPDTIVNSKYLAFAAMFYLILLVDGNNNIWSIHAQPSSLYLWDASSYKDYGLGTDPDSINKGRCFFSNKNYFHSIRFRAATLVKTESDWWRPVLDISKIYDPEDPYNGGDNSTDGGGDGDFDYDSDSDDFPPLPTTGVTDSGFVTLYAPNQAELKALAGFLWSDAFSIDTFKKMFNDPMACILGLSLVPVNVPTGAAQEITVGNIVSTVSCTTCASQYVYVDCGSIVVSPNNFTNSYLDYSPYTKFSLYLPFIGTQQLDADEIMGATIHVRYNIDILTGAMCCFVKVTKGSVSHILYTFMGQCCENVPLSSTSWSDTIGSLLNAAASIGGVVATAATGGAAAPVAVGMLSGATTATANAAQSMKPTVSHSGSMGGGGGMMAQRTPKLIMSAPNISKPQSQQDYTGYPTNRTLKLSECKGLTQVQAVNLTVSAEGVGATQAELDEIERLLKEGVYI